MNRKNKGFTLIELLIVIAIIGILAAVVLIAINPIEMMRRGRDSQRLSDMTQLRKAIDLFVVDNPDGFAADAAGDSASAPGSRAVDGTGWLGLNVSSTLATLPEDPSNDVNITSWAAAPPPANGMNCTFYYYYSLVAASTTYELNCMLESETNASKLTADGGNNASVFEVGTDAGLTLLDNPGGCVLNP